VVVGRFVVLVVGAAREEAVVAVALLLLVLRCVWLLVAGRVQAGVWTGVEVGVVVLVLCRLQWGV